MDSDERPVPDIGIFSGVGMSRQERHGGANAGIDLGKMIMGWNPNLWAVGDK